MRAAHRYEITHVNSVAESNTDIPNDTFTNVSAAKALTIATAAARVLGERPDPLWSRISAGLYIPLAPGGQHHLPFDPAVAGRSDEDFGGGPLSLLFLPSLDLAMSPELRRGDYEYAIRHDFARAGRWVQHGHRTTVDRRRHDRQRQPMPRPGSPPISPAARSSRRSTCAPKRPATMSGIFSPAPGDTCRAWSTVSADCAFASRGSSKRMRPFFRPAGIR